MKREIKFRAWDGNQMYEPFTLQMGLSMTETALRLKPPGWLFSEKNTYMQFTGLLDKNGKDIYEGDIVRCSQKSSYAREVVFSNGNYWLINPDRKMDWEIQVVYTSHPNTEIIGNIYENPHLLIRDSGDAVSDTTGNNQGGDAGKPINQGTDAPNEQSKEI